MNLVPDDVEDNLVSPTATTTTTRPPQPLPTPPPRVQVPPPQQPTTAVPSFSDRSAAPAALRHALRSLVADGVFEGLVHARVS